ncbi:MAG: DNA cytosine methyltransferase [Candidatus Woesearchaeota archaeon]
MQKKYAIDLFSGAGGVSKGLINAGLTVKAAVEIWDVAANTYEKNLGDIVIRKDIRDISGEMILNKINIKEKELFLLAGCPPCQGFSSHQKKRRGEKDKRNQLVFEYVRIANEIKPLFFLMENVPRMKKEGEIFKKAKNLLKKEYELKADVLNSANYGVPQTRTRLVVHGVRKDIYKKMKDKNIDIEFPRTTHAHSKSNNNLIPWVTVRDAISDLPPLKAGEENNNIANHFCARLSDKNLERMRVVRKGDGTRFSLPEELELPCHKRLRKKNGKSTHSYGDTYGIMEWDKPAPTLTGGCLSYTKGKYGHPEQQRAISAREAARLQTFMDDFVFEGNNQEIALQIGNAFPVKLAEASGKYFLELGNKLGLF